VDVVVDCVLLCGCFLLLLSCCLYGCLLVVVSYCCVVVGHEVLYLLVSDCHVAVCCWFCCVVVVFVLLCGWLLPILVAALPKALVCGRSLAGIAGSNLAGGMDVFLLRMLCVVR